MKCMASTHIRVSVTQVQNSEHPETTARYKPPVEECPVGPCGGADLKSGETGGGNGGEGATAPLRATQPDDQHLGVLQ